MASRGRGGTRPAPERRPRAPSRSGGTVPAVCERTSGSIGQTVDDVLRRIGRYRRSGLARRCGPRAARTSAPDRRCAATQQPHKRRSAPAEPGRACYPCRSAILRVSKPVPAATLSCRSAELLDCWSPARACSSSSRSVVRRAHGLRCADHLESGDLAPRVRPMRARAIGRGDGVLADDLRGRAAAGRMRSRRPCWPGECRPGAPSRGSASSATTQSLTQEQIELITKWVDGGIRRGNNPGLLPKPPAFEHAPPARLHAARASGRWVADRAFTLRRSSSSTGCCRAGPARTLDPDRGRLPGARSNRCVWLHDYDSRFPHPSCCAGRSGCRREP